MHELTCFQTIIFHCFNIDEVLCMGLFCFCASHNAPRSWNYELIYNDYENHIATTHTKKIIIIIIGGGDCDAMMMVGVWWLDIEVFKSYTLTTPPHYPELTQSGFPYLNNVKSKTSMVGHIWLTPAWAAFKVRL